MRPLAGAVDKLLHALHLDDELAEAAAVERWCDAAVSVMGADAARSRAIRIEKHTIVVAVPTAQWSGEIRLRERELIAALEALAPGCAVTHIRSVPDPRAASGP
ncbi:MAG: DUF721 domain-containing protein [Chloroflexi bacterium]|nr:DUF721 domain-containing protein [Chloroflexota bacterium]